ncbi:MAG: guanylate kinase [Desulfobacterales bacterium]|nr:guanylate kinase [Desulfobacterales bacterium]
MAPKGLLFIISGPSGTGKSTVLRVILEKRPELRYSISYTTRPPREGEQDGVDYDFISKDAFRKKMDSGEFAEWAEVHGELYGTPGRFLDEAFAAGHDVLLDIDVEGAKNIYSGYPEAVLIFIAPPSVEELEKRLVNRGADSSRAVEQRLKNSKAEMAEAHHYHHVIVNDDLAGTVSKLEAIIENARLK